MKAQDYIDNCDQPFDKEELMQDIRDAEMVRNAVDSIKSQGDQK